MEYRPVRIKDVISAINKDYFLPAIQREFVWEPDQIERLFDSILGDYPIGSFLFWKVDEKNKEQWTTFEFIRQFDKEHPTNPEANLKGISRDIYLILDGQQRITSLFIGLKGSFRFFHYPRGSVENRPTGVTSKPANGVAQDVVLIYPASLGQASLFWFSSSAVRT